MSERLSQNTQLAAYVWFSVSIPLLLAYPFVLDWQRPWAWLSLVAPGMVLVRAGCSCWWLWEVVLERDALVVRAIFRPRRRYALKSFTGFTPSGRFFNAATIGFSDGRRYAFDPKLKSWEWALEYTPENEFLDYWADEITERANARVTYG